MTKHPSPVREHPVVYALLHVLFRVLLVLLFGFTVRGRENIPRRGGVIIAANHASFLDPLVLGTASPRQLHYMARHDLWKHRWLVWFMNTCNAFPVRREGVAGEAFKRTLALLEAGKGVVMFPEGRRSADGRLGEGEPGVAMLASLSGAPIVPAAIIGTERALAADARMIRPARVRVIFGEPIRCDAEGLPRSERREAYLRTARELMDRIRALRQPYMRGDDA